MERDDLERAVLTALLVPPPFEGDYDDPWFADGPVAAAAIADRLRPHTGGSAAAVEQALSALESDGLAERIGAGDGTARSGGEGSSDHAPAGWCLTDRGKAAAERLPDRSFDDRPSRPPDDVDDECEWRSLLLLG